MKNSVAITLTIIHILTFSVCTYIAAIDIESILFTGWVCSATGLLAGIWALASRERALAAVSFLTPIVAVALTLLEINVLKLGPNVAARPFCIVFIVVQIITNLISFRSLWSGSNTKQISIRSLMLVAVGVSLVSAVSRQLLLLEHDIIMLIGLIMSGLTIVGVVITIFNLMASKPPLNRDMIK